MQTKHTPENDDANVLRWMGMLGHPFAVTCSDGKGGRTSRGECNDAITAKNWAAEAPEGRAFKRLKSGHYRQLAAPRAAIAKATGD